MVVLHTCISPLLGARGEKATGDIVGNINYLASLFTIHHYSLHCHVHCLRSCPLSLFIHCLIASSSLSLTVLVTIPCIVFLSVPSFHCPVHYCLHRMLFPPHCRFHLPIMLFSLFSSLFSQCFSFTIILSFIHYSSSVLYLVIITVFFTTFISPCVIPSTVLFTPFSPVRRPGHLHRGCVYLARVSTGVSLFIFLSR